jgi:glycosyltransferase involved in cell wall biosynthesis
MMTESPRPLSILHLLAPAPFGGLESVVRLLAQGQSARGAKVTVAALVEPRGGTHPFVGALRNEGVDVRPLVIPPRRYLRERGEVGALLRHLRPDVMHTHGYRPDVLDSPVARALGIATVSTVHGFTGNGPRNRFYEWLQRRSLRHADAVVAVSRPQVDDLARSSVPRDRIRLIPNAWTATSAPLSRAAARDVLALGEAERVIGFVGRLGVEKGPDLLVRALAEPELRERVACFVGDGSGQRDAMELARTLGVAERIRWKGSLPEASRLMAAFDVVALPSRTEGTPIVLFEAAAAGVPVVACAVGGVPDVLGAGFNLVPAHDPAALASALARALDSPADAAEAVARSVARIRVGHAMGPWIERHLELYRELARTVARSDPALAREGA